jgi:hypothetical protein
VSIVLRVHVHAIFQSSIELRLFAFAMISVPGLINLNQTWQKADRTPKGTWGPDVAECRQNTKYPATRIADTRRLHSPLQANMLPNIYELMSKYRKEGAGNQFSRRFGPGDSFIRFWPGTIFSNTTNLSL